VSGRKRKAKVEEHGARAKPKMALATANLPRSDLNRFCRELRNRSWPGLALQSSTHSLSLAVDMLAPNGTFITKISRSKEYTPLLYVFNQFFRKVEATKPPSSRNVSAEIFVVCQGFKAPRKIDPRLLDPAHVFKDIDLSKVVEGDEEATSSTLTPNAQNVFHPEKKRRARDGYEEGDYALFRAVPVMDLINTRDPVKILGTASRFDFATDEEKRLAKLEVTAPEIKESMKDVKVLGKSDFKKFLKWRTAVRQDLGMVVKTKDVQELTEVDPIEIDEEQVEEEIFPQVLPRMVSLSEQMNNVHLRVNISLHIPQSKATR